MFVRLKDFTLYCGVCDGGMIQHWLQNDTTAEGIVTGEYFIRCFNKECEEFNHSFKLPTIPVERFLEVIEDDGVDADTSGDRTRDQISEGLRDGESIGSEEQNGEATGDEVSL